MALRRLLLVFSCLLAVVGIATRYSPSVSAGEGFQPPSPEELSMKSEPLAPGAPAIILYRQVDRDDTGLTKHEYNYVRIKILTEEGRKHADVEIPFFKQDDMVSSIGSFKARTIEPDGTIVPFEGKPYEKSIVKSRGRKVLAKVFTFPKVEVGSILEYYYTLDLPEYYVIDSSWILNDELFTKKAKFSLKPNNNFGLRWTWQGLPAGSPGPKQSNDKLVRLEVGNMAAFKTEDYMPPENELKARVDFFYSESNEDIEQDPARFWKKKGRRLNDQVESFVGKRKAMEEAVAQIVAPSDPPEVKVRKIYDKVQSIRNTSFEVRKSEQERKRDKEKTASNVEEVWKKGYGNGFQLTWLFLGLVRAAGIEAYPVMVSDRQNYFFYPNTMDANRLNTNVVLVKVGGKELYCDPGAAFTPFGLLEWQETGVKGLRLDKDGGSWIQTTTPAASESRVERKANFTLSNTGELEGKVTITFTGLEAMDRRMDERHQDEAARKKYLEDQIKEYIPAASEVELTNKPDWTSSSAPLVAEFTVKIPGWVSAAGRRALFPMGIFGATEKRVFDHAERVHPIYFEFPFEKVDDITVTLPAGWQVSSVPQEQNVSNNAVAYLAKAEKGKDSIHLTRTFRIGFFMLDQKYYPTLRDFFQAVRQGDEQQILLQPGATNAAN